MDVENNKGSDVVIYGHKVCQTRNVKWMCLDHIYQKFHRPNLYDIGGTYIQDVADFWLIYKTEQVGNIFLLHLFICNRQEGSFTVGVSAYKEFNLDRKNNIVYFPTSLKQHQYVKPKEMTQLYLTTYSFSDLDVEFLKDKTLYIAVNFPAVQDQNVQQQDFIDFVKMKHDFGALLKDPIGSDFTIESAEGDQFKVHKVLLSAHSEVFKAMLKAETAESQNSYVKLVDVSTEDLSHILEFIYTGTIKDESYNFINLLILADQYNLVGLRELSEHALTQQLNMENAVEILVYSDLYNIDNLKLQTIQFIKKNPTVLQNSTIKQIKNVDLMRFVNVWCFNSYISIVSNMRLVYKYCCTRLTYLCSEYQSQLRSQKLYN